jgi:hypothetical protein
MSPGRQLIRPSWAVSRLVASIGSRAGHVPGLILLSFSRLVRFVTLSIQVKRSFECLESGAIRPCLDLVFKRSFVMCVTGHQIGTGIQKKAKL